MCVLCVCVCIYMLHITHYIICFIQVSYTYLVINIYISIFVFLAKYALDLFWSCFYMTLGMLQVNTIPTVWITYH